MKKMTSRERVFAVLNHQIPDCVPHFEWVYDQSIIKDLTGDGSYEDLIDLLDVDAVMCKPDYQVSKLGPNLIKDEWGVTRETGAVEYAMPKDHLAPIKNRDDAEKWEPPSPFAPHRWDTLKKRISIFKGKRAIFINLRDVWSHPRDLLGYINLCVFSLEDPILVNGVIEKCVDHTLKVAKIAAQLGAEVVVTGDDIADSKNTLISPKLWKELFLPHYRKLIKGFHDMGLFYWKHSDGNIMPILDSLVEVGIDGIDPIDPLGGMDLGNVKHLYGDKIAIKGNVDCVNVLTSGTEKDVIDSVKKCISIAGKNGRYVCSSSNSIFQGIKPNLYKAMVEAIHTYGQYPLNFDLLKS